MFNILPVDIIKMREDIKEYIQFGRYKETDVCIFISMTWMNTIKATLKLKN